MSEGEGQERDLDRVQLQPELIGLAERHANLGLAEALVAAVDEEVRGDLPRRFTAEQIQVKRDPVPKL